MNEPNTIIKVRPVFRVLGIAICIGGIFILFSLFFGKPVDGDPEKYSFLVSVLVTSTILLPSCILGRVPEFIIKRIPEDGMEYFKHSEKFFLEHSGESTAFAISFLTVAGFYIWVSMH